MKKNHGLFAYTLYWEHSSCMVSYERRVEFWFGGFLV